jgi:hypothetical protein
MPADNCFSLLIMWPLYRNLSMAASAGTLSLWRPAFAIAYSTRFSFQASTYELVPNHLLKDPQGW